MLHSCLFLPWAISLSSALQQNVLKGGDVRDNNAGPLNTQFAGLVNKTLGFWKVPGIAVAVIDGDEIFAEGYGIAEYPETKATASTLWYGGSTTKAFTAAALSLLVDDNSTFSAVEWTTPISQLIRDDFVLENDYATTHITIEDALSHRTGLPRHEFSHGASYDGREATPRDLTRSLRYLPLAFETRTTFSYCNLMYAVATHVVEALTGSWLGDFLRERIWDPLGMSSTYFSVAEAISAPEHLARGYVYANESFHPVPHVNLAALSGAGSVISNVLDYSKWVSSLLQRSGPLSGSAYRDLFRGRILLDEPQGAWAFTGQEAYALGWLVTVYRGHRVFQHSGSTDAFAAEVFLFPDLNYGLVAFGNTAGTGNSAEEKLLWHLADEKLGIPENERFDWDGKSVFTLPRLTFRASSLSASIHTSSTLY
ncbi:penicillin-binding protein [Phlyctema vagabunda]|uniref:Penicillin-binding protein n=1 Tax=Phlyctema vagabunda TaxID=108571 RepID=A0ABR4PXT0_9HELO